MATKFSLSSNFFLILLVLLVKYSEETKLAPALYIFGDSSVDAGNNVFLLNLTKILEKPLPDYCMDHPIRSAYRLCNGRTVADFLAEKLGLHYQPAALNTKISLRETIEGLNFGSTSAGILNETGKNMMRNIYLGDQVELFKKTVEQQLPKLLENKAAIENHLSRSIFFVVMGGNDYILNYEFNDQNKRYISPDAYATLLVNLFIQQIQRMYQLGAKKFVISELAALGCIPDVLKKSNTTGQYCNEKVNEDVVLFNNKLQHELQRMSSINKDATFVTLKSFNITLDLVNGHEKYGFVDPRNYCHEPYTPNVCGDRDAHIFYDSAHPSQAANKIVADGCFSGKGFCVPINLQELAMKN